MASTSALTYRLRGCPATADEAALRGGLAQALGDVRPEDIYIQSLATAIGSWERSPTKTATLRFAKLPSVVGIQTTKEWKIEGHGLHGTLILDTHFLGLTPLNETQAHEHRFDCVAVSGLGSHPFGSWQPKGSENKGWMWLRDALPIRQPSIRAVLFGYDTTLAGSDSFKSIPHLASSLNDTLEASGLGTSASKPLIFLAHSLGGIIVEEALVASASSHGRGRQILQRTAGAVLFGTPARGMETQALMTMVSGQANAGLIRDLTAPSGYLRSLEDRFFDVATDGRMKLFWAFETKTSPTVSQQEDGSYNRTGPKAILVTPESATRGLHGTHSPNIFPIDETHSDMVKFGEGAPICDVVLGKLGDICSAYREAGVVGDTGRPKRYWMVPFGRNRDFVGRESILAQLLERIPPGADKDDCQRTAIEGLGGVGKTQIALQAAFRVRDEHPNCSVFWVPAVDATSFENAYREIGRELGVEGIDGAQADVKALVRAALPTKIVGSWLLIIDNADDVDLLVGASSLAGYLPFGYNGSILFTTRNHEVAVRLDIPERNIIPTTEMDTAEATMLLRRGVKESQMRDTNSTTALLGVLAYLPLAIRQASAYMAKTGISTTRYLEHCRSSDKHWIKLLSKDFEDQGRYKTIQNPIATTWVISFDQISRSSQLATTYLKSMCFLAEKDIPLALLPAGDELEIDEAFGTLKAYAFATEREHASYDMHRLVRLAMRNWLEREEELEEQVTSTLKRLDDVFPIPRFNNRDLWHRHLPHVLAALEFRDACVDKMPKGYLLWKVGVCYYLLGNFHRAEQLYREASTLIETVRGKKHLDTLNSKNHLARTLNNQGKHEEAEEIHRQVLELRETTLGREHRDTLCTMNNLACALDNQGKYKQAEEMHRQALKSRETTLGRQDSHTLESMNNLAIVLHNQGKFKEAEQMHRQVLEVEETVRGAEHLDTLGSLRNLASTVDDQGRYKEAEEIQGRALEGYRRVLGPEHPRTLGTMSHLATILQHQGRYDEAEQMHRRAAELMEKVLGRKDRSAIWFRAKLADCTREKEEARKQGR